MYLARSPHSRNLLELRYVTEVFTLREKGHAPRSWTIGVTGWRKVVPVDFFVRAQSNSHTKPKDAKWNLANIFAVSLSLRSRVPPVSIKISIRLLLCSLINWQSCSSLNCGSCSQFYLLDSLRAGVEWLGMFVTTCDVSDSESIPRVNTNSAKGGERNMPITIGVYVKQC